MHLREIDWKNWTPRDLCVVTYLRRTLSDGRQQVLLIDKKTGFGNGLVNAPGGHIEPGETPLQAAVREYREETGLEIGSVRQVGLLNFQFTDGYSLRGWVFLAGSFTGEPVETAEARPFWQATDTIPYDRMWGDDRYWLPLALSGTPFCVHSTFAGRRIISLRLTKEV